jgi:hypothetical protein
MNRQARQWCLHVLWPPRRVAGQQLIIKFANDTTALGKKPTALGISLLQECKEKSIKTFNNIF